MSLCDDSSDQPLCEANSTLYVEVELKEIVANFSVSD